MGHLGVLVRPLSSRFIIHLRGCSIARTAHGGRCEWVSPGAVIGPRHGADRTHSRRRRPAPRRKLGLAPGQLAARGAAPAVSQYEIIDSDAILVCEEPSLTSFVASDRPSFRIRRVRPRRCVPSENLKSSSPTINKRLQIFRFPSTPPGRYPRGSQKALPRGDICG